MSEVDLRPPADVAARIEAVMPGVVEYITVTPDDGDRIFGIRVLYAGKTFEKTVSIHPDADAQAMLDKLWPKLADNAADFARQLREKYP